MVCGMYAGGVLKRVDGLTYDRLTYFVRAGYVKPRKIKSQSLYYNDFSEEDVVLIERAWELISKHKVKIKTAFQRARERGEDIQLTLNLRTPPGNPK
jgi:meiotically up-regulated gene 157 (Mug157) protein